MFGLICILRSRLCLPKPLGTFFLFGGIVLAAASAGVGKIAAEHFLGESFDPRGALEYQESCRVSALGAKSGQWLALRGAAEVILQEFRRAIGPRAWSFPRDHGCHSEFQTEWWYFTGNVHDARGRRFGFQLTFFRHAVAQEESARPSSLSASDLYAAHFALSDVARQRFFYDQRLAGEALGTAGAAEDSLDVRLQDWSVREKTGYIHVRAMAGFGAIDLALHSVSPPALHREGGLARKGELAGQASYYYSLPHLPTRGTLTIRGQQFVVSGVSWMDHEFGSYQLASGDIGWDWFALHLPDSVEVMIYRLRRADGSIAPYSAGSLMRAGRVVRHLGPGDFACTPVKWWKSAASGARYPIEWEVEFDAYRLKVRAAFADQELDTRPTTRVIYWEGFATVSGTRARRDGRIHGEGYVEMTGYAPSGMPRF